MKYFQNSKKNELGSLENNKREGGLKGFQDFLQEEDGMGTVEIILIIVVLIGLVIIFKNQISAIVTKLFGKITNEVDKF